MLARFPPTDRSWTLPVLVALYESAEADCGRGHSYLTPHQHMTCLLALMLHWFPDRRSIFVGVSAYGIHEIVPFADLRGSRLGPVGKLHLEDKLFRSPRAVRGPGSHRGHGRLAGLPSEAIAAARRLKRSKAGWYGVALAGSRRPAALATGSGRARAWPQSTGRSCATGRKSTGIRISTSTTWDERRAALRVTHRAVAQRGFVPGGPIGLAPGGDVRAPPQSGQETLRRLRWYRTRYQRETFCSQPLENRLDLPRWLVRSPRSSRSPSPGGFVSQGGARFRGSVAAIGHSGMSSVKRSSAQSVVADAPCKRP